MITVDIPGYRTLTLEHLVLDYNGTLACDGEILPGVKKSLEALSTSLKIHVLTADTFGKVKDGMAGVPCKISVLPREDQIAGKRNYIEKLGRQRTVCIGNGRNDQLMLKDAALGIAVILDEGAAVESINAADVIFTSIQPALELLRNPLRLTATLRS